MSFLPQVPLSGVAGWRFLERTQAAQQTVFEKSAQLQRDIDYFRENIASIETAADLVADRRLLKVALGAFGLEDEVAKKALVRKVMEEGTEDTGALANRLTNRAFYELTSAFGFGNAAGAQTATAGFAEKIIAAYKDRAFEGAVGESNENMRLAMNFKREIAKLAEGEGGSWFAVMGSQSMAKVVQKAFGLPESFGQLDVDKQRAVLMEKSAKLFGTNSLTAFQDPANVDKMITRFLARAQIEEGVTSATSPAAAALTLLQSSSSEGSNGIMNLLASRI